MLSLDDYIELALKEAEITSDVKLCHALDLSKSQVSYWRSRKTLPSDETMAKLAKLAKMDVELALLNLGWWRAVSRNEHLAATSYKKLIENYHPIAA